MNVYTICIESEEGGEEAEELMWNMAYFSKEAAIESIVMDQAEQRENAELPAIDGHLMIRPSSCRSECWGLVDTDLGVTWTVMQARMQGE